MAATIQQMQQLLASMADRGATAAVMEVTSIGLDQGRVDDVTYSVAVFTNLTRDHIDYHGNFENYKRAKLRQASALSCSSVPFHRQLS